jgi:hypothetical protein
VPAQEALEAGAVVALDAHGGVDAEPGGRDRLEDLKWYPPALRSSPTGSLPREHVEGVELIEEPVSAEVPKHATLNDALEPDPVLGPEARRLVEDDGTSTSPRTSVMGQADLSKRTGKAYPAWS